MKAVVFHGIGDIRMDNVSEPKIKDANDVIVRLTASAICGTDLHMVRGTFVGMKPGRVLGHEGVGVVEQVGANVRNFRRGDRVVVGSTSACGSCNYCRAGYYAQCNNANPMGPNAGTAFFGGPEMAGGFDGMQAEYVRVPYGNVGCVGIPEGVSDDQAILISDIFPTGYMAAEIAEIKPGDAVCVFGCGPVGQFAIASAKLMNAGRIFAVDCIPSRLEMARVQGAEVIDFNRENPVDVLRQLTNGSGPDRVIDCVGVDAVHAHHGPATKEAAAKSAEFKMEQKKVAPKTNPQDGNWEPGDAPSQVLDWMVQSVAKAGTISIIGVYPQTMKTFPIGEAMNKNLAINMGNCHHRRYIPMLLDMVRSGVVDPTEILTHSGPLVSAIEAYHHFDKREPGWVKVMLDPAAAPSIAA
jgi:threonine dehydrogenase-like Zn-dependent dehydrogenase